jgi:cell division protein FtsL
MHKVLNAILVVTVLISGFVLYSLEHVTRGLERKVAKLQGGIDEEIENARFLNAEWSSLTRPDRLQKLTEQHLDLQTMKPSQIVRIEELSQRLPAEPVVKLEADGSDPIGTIIGKMQ